jgi:hypothetical protein
MARRKLYFGPRNAEAGRIFPPKKNGREKRQLIAILCFEFR